MNSQFTLKTVCSSMKPIALGIAIGTAVGVATKNVSVGIAIGAAVAIIFTLAWRK